MNDTLTPLARLERISGDARRSRLAVMRAEYEAGSSIRSVASMHGRSYGSAHRMLLEAGTVLRPRGGGYRS